MGRREAKRKGTFLRHEGRKVPERVGVPDPETALRVFDHVMRWLHPLDWTVSDGCDDTIALDWVSAGPTGRRPFRTLVTAGMSVAPMFAPLPGDARLLWAELVMLLPPDWPLDVPALREERHSWPLSLTADLARLPHLCDTFLWTGHTFEFGDPPGPLYPGLPFTGVVLAETDLLPDGFWAMPVRPGKEVRFLGVFPCHEAELRHAQREGVDALIDRWNEAGVSDVVDPTRPSACG